MNLTNDSVIQRRAADVMPGDCVRVTGCWETVYMAERVGLSGRLRIWTDAGSHEYDANAMIETTEEEG